MKITTLILIISLLFLGCGIKREDCEKNQTGEVVFNNNSQSGKTYDIIWDGVMIATVEPSKESKVFTYAANVPHKLVFRITNTKTNACTESTPILNQCQENTFSCSE
ncbi:MAG: hypothetical protein MUF58_09095 [Arcicella sp.]|jgi:hypothetical protein|nr:hypothetical protein [Arcicella sp.]